MKSGETPIFHIVELHLRTLIMATATIQNGVVIERNVLVPMRDIAGVKREE
jgi:hypothetical protein